MFNWFNMKKKSLPEQVLENTKDIEKLYDQELSDITQLNYKQDAEDSLTYADGKATFKGKMSIIRNENTQNLVVDSEIEVNISSGDDDIIIDAGEDNVSLKIRLDNDTRNKISRALLTPITTPTEREFVAIGTNNAQIMIPESEIKNKSFFVLSNSDDSVISIDLSSSSAVIVNSYTSKFLKNFTYDENTGILTCNKKGRYYIRGCYNVNYINNNFLRVDKNGVSVLSSHTNYTDTPIIEGVLSLCVGDTIGFRILNVDVISTCKAYNASFVGFEVEGAI